MHVAMGVHNNTLNTHTKLDKHKPPCASQKNCSLFYAHALIISTRIRLTEETEVVTVLVVVGVSVVVVVVVEVAPAVGLDPAAIGGADHALVLVLAPEGRHAVVVLEEVGRLVHQRRVAPARQNEPLPAAMVPACSKLTTNQSFFFF